MRPIPRIARKDRSQLAKSTASTVDVPAPAGGLNTRDSLALMPITDAIMLVNWIPQANGLRARNGSKISNADYTTKVESVIPYVSGATKVLITAHNNRLYSDTGTAETELASGFANNRWFAAKIGANMVLVNGADAPRNFDGSAITTPSITGDLGSYGASNIDGIAKFKSRLYMWDSGYGNFFYGGVNSVSGAFTEFNLNRVSNTGGNILEIKTISRDAGDGADDFIAFILDTGEIIVYQGGNPSDAQDWFLVGKYMTPPLVAKGCAHEFAGDVLLLTRADLVKLSDIIKYSGQEGGFNIKPSKLCGAIAEDYRNYGSNYGWQLTSHPQKGWIIVNVPEVAGSVFHQYIVDTTTGGSTKFEGWHALQFGYLDGVLYFGGATDLWKADSGLTDNGADINLLALPAYNNLGVSRRKRVSNARLYMLSEGALNVDLAIGYDYESPTFQGTQTSQTDGAEWDVAEWDVAEWAGLSARLVNFVTSGLGLYVTAQTSMKISGQECVWYSTTYNFDVASAY